MITIVTVTEIMPIAHTNSNARLSYASFVVQTMTRRRAPVSRAARVFHNQFTQAAALGPAHVNEAVAASCFLAL